MDKGDIFAIGMILLEFCTLQPSSECYDEENYSIVDSSISLNLFSCEAKAVKNKANLFIWGCLMYSKNANLRNR